MKESYSKVRGANHLSLGFWTRILPLNNSKSSHPRTTVPKKHRASITPEFLKKKNLCFQNSQLNDLHFISKKRSMDGRMYETQQQHLLDLQDNSGFGSDPKSWLSGDDLRRTLSSLSAAAATASATGNVDRVLFNDLVEMVPLVQSLIVITLISVPCFCHFFFPL